jgi:hypothetical protein
MLSRSSRIVSDGAVKLALKIVLVVVLTVAFGALLVWLASACGPRSAGFAFLLVWLTMCWVTLISLAFPLRLPAAYFALRPAERHGRRYKMLGVLVAKRLLRRGPLQIFNPKLHLPPVLEAQSLAKLDAAMRTAETNHVFMFVVVLPVIGHAIVRAWWDAAAWTLLFDVLINAYPVMLQRYNRGRLASLTRNSGRETGPRLLCPKV